MLAILVGIILILIGLGWAIMAMWAAGMASRKTTRWENAGRPALGLIPLVLGVAILIWG